MDDTDGRYVGAMRYESQRRNGAVIRWMSREIDEDIHAIADGAWPLEPCRRPSSGEHRAARRPRPGPLLRPDRA